MAIWVKFIFFLKLYKCSFNLRRNIKFQQVGLLRKKFSSKWDAKISCQMKQSTWSKPLKMRSYIIMDKKFGFNGQFYLISNLNTHALIKISKKN
jgi:hypothetical protein